MLDTGCWFLDAGYWMLDAGYWMLDAGCWMLDAGCWILDAGYWMLDAGCWMLDAGCWILDAGCWMLDTGCWMLDTGKLKLGTVNGEPDVISQKIRGLAVSMHAVGVFENTNSLNPRPDWMMVVGTSGLHLTPCSLYLELSALLAGSPASVG